MAAVRFFTIVDRRTDTPFALRLANRPAVVAFKHFQNAHLTAKSIEMREVVQGTMSETYDLVPAEAVGEPEHHFLRACSGKSAKLAQTGPNWPKLAHRV